MGVLNNAEDELYEAIDSITAKYEKSLDINTETTYEEDAYNKFTIITITIGEENENQRY